jgi:hypothetical protein
MACVGACDSAADGSPTIHADGSRDPIDASGTDDSMTAGDGFAMSDSSQMGDSGQDGNLGNDDEGDATAIQDAPSDFAPPADAGPGGLLYYFPLAGDTNDYSGNGNNATSTGTMPTTGHSGKMNSAQLFNGTTAYMTAPGGKLPVGIAPRTLTLWANPTNRVFTIAGWGLANCTGPTGGTMFSLGTATNEFWGGCDDVGDGVGPPLGAWTFLAAVFSTPGQVRIFVNRTAATYNLPTNLSTKPSMLWIGAATRTNTANVIFNYFGGAIDSIRIYDHALSDAEVGVVMGLP